MPHFTFKLRSFSIMILVSEIHRNMVVHTSVCFWVSCVCTYYAQGYARHILLFTLTFADEELCNTDSTRHEWPVPCEAQVAFDSFVLGLNQVHPTHHSSQIHPQRAMIMINI
jgi:hypothetical protein